MQPRPRAETSRPLFPSLRFCMSILRWSVSRLCGRARQSFTGAARRDLDCRGSGAGADHGAQVRAATILRAVSVIDAIVDRPIDRLEIDFFRHAGGYDPPRVLPHCSLIPARNLPVVAAHIEGI